MLGHMEGEMWRRWWGEGFLSRNTGTVRSVQLLLSWMASHFPFTSTNIQPQMNLHFPTLLFHQIFLIRRSLQFFYALRYTKKKKQKRWVLVKWSGKRVQVFIEACEGIVGLLIPKHNTQHVHVRLHVLLINYVLNPLYLFHGDCYFNLKSLLYFI